MCVRLYILRLYISFKENITNKRMYQYVKSVTEIEIRKLTKNKLLAFVIRQSSRPLSVQLLVFFVYLDVPWSGESLFDPATAETLVPTQCVVIAVTRSCRTGDDVTHPVSIRWWYTLCGKIKTNEGQDDVITHTFVISIYTRVIWIDFMLTESRSLKLPFFQLVKSVCTKLYIKGHR